MDEDNIPIWNEKGHKIWLFYFYIFNLRLIWIFFLYHIIYIICMFPYNCLFLWLVGPLSVLGDKIVLPALILRKYNKPGIWKNESKNVKTNSQRMILKLGLILSSSIDIFGLLSGKTRTQRKHWRLWLQGTKGKQIFTKHNSFLWFLLSFLPSYLIFIYGLFWNSLAHFLTTTYACWTSCFLVLLSFYFL